MANPEQLRILERGVEAWNIWRSEHRNIYPDLSSADLYEINLADANLFGGNLTGASLSRASLSRANLTGADLIGAVLTHASLNDADLTHANLAEATLAEANLCYTNLHGANLTHANLTYASLNDANLRYANLTGADVSGVSLDDTDFIGTNLTAVRGLETCKHYGPSTLDHRTLAKSGPLPLAFLRGCGLSDWEIEATKLYQRGLTPTQIHDSTRRIYGLRADPQYHSCFISHSHTDADFACRFEDRLQERGIRCWRYEQQMLPGDDLYTQIARGIQRCDKVLLCCSTDALTSWWVDHEIDLAFEKERNLMRTRGEKVLVLIPLDLDGFLHQWPSGKAQQVRSRFAADFVGWLQEPTKFETQLERVICALRADPGAREEPPATRL